MTESVWDILGMDAPSDDLRAIKKAYAQQLRLNRPDDDSADFMQLREAYEHARFSAIYAQEALQHDVAGHAETKILHPLAGAQKSGIQKRTPKNYAYLLHRAKALTANETLRNEREAWNDIFDNPELEHIDTFLDFEANLRYHFLEIFGYFSRDDDKSNLEQTPRTIGSDIGLLLFRKLGWHDIFTRPNDIQSEIRWLRRDLGIEQRLGGPVIFPDGYVQRRAYDSPDDSGEAFLLLIPLVVLFLSIAWAVENAS